MADRPAAAAPGGTGPPPAPADATARCTTAGPAVVWPPAARRTGADTDAGRGGATSRVDGRAPTGARAPAGSPGEGALSGMGALSGPVDTDGPDGAGRPALGGPSAIRCTGVTSADADGVRDVGFGFGIAGAPGPRPSEPADGRVVPCAGAPACGTGSADGAEGRRRRSAAPHRPPSPAQGTRHHAVRQRAAPTAPRSGDRRRPVVRARAVAAGHAPRPTAPAGRAHHRHPPKRRFAAPQGRRTAPAAGSLNYAGSRDTLNHRTGPWRAVGRLPRRDGPRQDRPVRTDPPTAAGPADGCAPPSARAPADGPGDTAPGRTDPR